MLKQTADVGGTEAQGKRRIESPTKRRGATEVSFPVRPRGGGASRPEASLDEARRRIEA